jgi:hypothetical protein
MVSISPGNNLCKYVATRQEEENGFRLLQPVSASLAV